MAEAKTDMHTSTCIDVSRTILRRIQSVSAVAGANTYRLGGCGVEVETPFSCTEHDDVRSPKSRAEGDACPLLTNADRTSFFLHTFFDVWYSRRR